MKKKYILALTFFCLLIGHISYSQDWMDDDYLWDLGELETVNIVANGNLPFGDSNNTIHVVNLQIANFPPTITNELINYLNSQLVVASPNPTVTPINITISVPNTSNNNSNSTTDTITTTVNDTTSDLYWYLYYSLQGSGGNSGGEDTGGGGTGGGGTNDPPPPPPPFWYLDYDGDGWYSQITQAENCPGDKWNLWTNGLDCDDNDSTKTMFCSLILTWYLDEDGDGYYSQVQLLEHSPGPNWSLWIPPTNIDCDDTKQEFTTVCCPAGNILINNVCTDPCDLLNAAAEVYDLNPDDTNNGNDQAYMETAIGGNWNLADTSNISGLMLKKGNIGFNSALYVREVNGAKQYMYATQGTGTDTLNNFSTDMKANALQIFGDSEQYDLSVENAKLISDYVHNTGGTLVFVGHSLGGGMASYNALATGWDAFTYNAAGLSDATKGKLQQTFTANINATVIKGEIVDKLQAIIGLKAESSNGIHYINGPSTFWINLLDDISYYSPSPTKLETVAEYAIRVKAHLIDELKTALNCN